jgi:hypothetical protein
MEDIFADLAEARTEAEYEALFARQMAEIQFLNERMQRDRADIDRLKIETDALKAEGARLEAETQAILTRLKAMV